MAAPSVGRRSCVREEKRRLCKSKPPLHRRVEMCLLYDGFFFLPSCGRMLLHIQFNASSEIFTFNADIVSAFRECNCIAICSGCF